ncbi:MAG: polysulfide reductase, partial [Deltaproteobacteria bacterium]|nr:polysulfide reductase [Deltaproteobacteria bacterium]
MKHFIKDGFKPVDSLNDPTDGHQWNIMQKLLLGLSPQEYFQQLRRNPFNWFLFMIFAVGLPVI